MAKKNDPGIHTSFDDEDSERLKNTNPLSSASGKPYRRPTRGKNRVLRIGRWIALIIIILVILMFVVTTVRNSTQAQENKKIAQQAYNPSFKTRYNDIGELTVRNYLTGEASPISYTSDTQWKKQSSLLDKNSNTTNNDSGSNEENTGGENGKAEGSEGESPEVDQLTFVGGKETDFNIPDGDKKRLDDFTNPKAEILKYYAVYNGKPVYVSITIGIPDMNDASKLPVLMAAPSIESPEGIEQVSGLENSPKGKLDKEDVSKSGKKQLQRWANAWAKDDTGSLQQITKDNSSDHVYSGIGGWEASDETMNVKWSYKKNFSGKKGDYIVAEVEFDIKQEYQGQEYTNKQTMDVLLGDIDSGLPSVVSWGPMGTWSELEPNSVAKTVGEDEQKPSSSSSESSDSFKSASPSSSSSN